jgi:hypothetical protein
VVDPREAGSPRLLEVTCPASYPRVSVAEDAQYGAGFDNIFDLLDSADSIGRAAIPES